MDLYWQRRTIHKYLSPRNALFISLGLVGHRPAFKLQRAMLISRKVRHEPALDVSHARGQNEHEVYG